MSQRTVFTIGHSTRSIEDFMSLLKQHQIGRLVDIRTIPKSRHNPQYAQENLERSLVRGGIEYTYLASLGGLRPAVKESHNTAWRNTSFRNYADYMQTDEFANGLRELLAYSEADVVAIMCAEAVPWRCHRSLVADALVIRDVRVCEVISPTSAREHILTSFAKVQGEKVTYPKTESPHETSGYA